MNEEKKNDIVEETTTPTESPTSNENAESTTRRHPKWLVPAIAAGAAVVLVGAGFGGWHAYTTHELNAAKTACAQAGENVREAANAYSLVVNGGASDASGIKADQVKDTKTLDALSKALKETAPEYEGCVADGKDGLDAATLKLNSQAKWYESHEKSLTEAVKAVNASKAAKTLEIAKNALSKRLDEAAKLLKDSDGKVQDNATREALAKAIDAGNKLKGGKEPSKLDEARKTLESAAKGVNDSIAAKTKADEEAAATAAQAAAAAQAQAPTRTRSNSYSNTNYRYRGNGNGGQSAVGNGGNSARNPSTSSSPTPTPQPPTSSNDGFDACFVYPTDGSPSFEVPCN